MKKTKIEWCDSTWNPVSGCLHDCEYCYARKMANRFKCSTEVFANKVEYSEMISSGIYEGTYRCAYPFGFKPTFYHERLVIPKNWTKGKTIFVCSMADLFGEWVPDEWIEKVMKACVDGPQHNYLFLTKNPGRYAELVNAGLIISAPNMWYGSTATNSRMKRFVKPKKDNTKYNTFTSIEPLLERWDINPYGEFENTQWVIIGAESGNRKGKVVPEKEWIDEIVDQCDRTRTPVFMKDSLIPIIGEKNMRREFPKELEKTTRREDTRQLIGNMNSHCDDCPLIDWCGEPYEDPYLCMDRRFENVRVSKYISIAESSTVKLGELADIDASEVNRDDYDCVSDYEDDIDGILLNAYKALVADDVEKSLKISKNLEAETAGV